MKAACAKSRKLLECLADQRDKRIDHRSTHPQHVLIDAALMEDAANRGVVQVELLGDRADRPLLGQMQAEDLRLALRRDHRATSSRSSTSSSSKSPRPVISSSRRLGRDLGTTEIS